MITTPHQPSKYDGMILMMFLPKTGFEGGETPSIQGTIALAYLLVTRMTSLKIRGAGAFKTVCVSGEKCVRTIRTLSQTMYSTGRFFSMAERAVTTGAREAKSCWSTERQRLHRPGGRLRAALRNGSFSFHTFPFYKVASSIFFFLSLV